MRSARSDRITPRFRVTARAVRVAAVTPAPLAKKLGINPGSRLAFIAVPPTVKRELRGATADCSFTREDEPVDLVLLFVRDAVALESTFSRWASSLQPAGSIWVAWPKKSSGIATDFDFNVVQRIGLASGLVDNKVCSIDATWSALRFVIRLKDRRR